MKKSIYLLATCVFFSQSVQAGRLFDYFVDEDGNKAVHFKKCGHKFNSALNQVAMFGRNHEIRQIYFHDYVSDEQKAKVFNMLSNQLNLVDMGNGLLDKAQDYEVAKGYLNAKKSTGFVFKEDKGLDLRYASSALCTKYLPFAHKLVEGMDKVTSLHVSLSAIDPKMLEAVKTTLIYNKRIKNIFFHDENTYLSTKITNIISDLLFVPGEVTYYFNRNSLSQLSSDFLDRNMNGLTAAWVQKCSGQKAVVSLVNNYMGDYNDYKLQSYKEVCKNPKYSPIFKASYVDYVNEREQRTHLLKMQEANSLELQVKSITEILEKEELGYKALPIYTKDFLRIRDILTAQFNIKDQTNAVYMQLENEKRGFIQSVLNRMWVNNLPPAK